MTIIYTALLLTLYVYNFNLFMDLLEDEEEFEEANNNLPNNRYNLSHFLVNSTSDDEEIGESSAIEEFTNDPVNDFESSCAVTLFAIERTVKVRDRDHFVLRRRSLINGILIFEHYVLTAAELVQDIRETLVLKTAEDVVRVSRIFIIDGTNIAILKLCRRVISVPSCEFAYEQVSPQSNCSSIPSVITSRTFSGSVKDVAQFYGTSVPCPDKLVTSFCCFRSSQTICDSNKGTGIVSGTNVLGVITGSHNNCESESISYFTPIVGLIHFKIQRAITSSLGCENCADLSNRIPERI